MGHVEALAERILFLKGDVQMAAAESVETITDPAKMLARRSKWNRGAPADYNGAAQNCGANADAVSKQLFERLVADEEGHQNEFERQLENIKRFGLSYLALQSFGAAAAPETAESEREIRAAPDSRLNQSGQSAGPVSGSHIGF